MDPHTYQAPKLSTAEQVADLGLFASAAAPPEPPAPTPAEVRSARPALHHANEHSQALEERLRVRAGTNNARIVSWLRTQGDATRKEIAAGTGIPINVVTPCVVSLRRNGHLLELDGKNGRPFGERDGGYLLRAVR